MSADDTHVGIVARQIDAQHYRITIEPQGGCHNCKMKKLCGQGTVNKTAFSSIPLEKGDRVTFHYVKKAPLLASFLIYIVPILFLAAAVAFISWRLPENQAMQAVGGIAALLIGWCIIYFLTRRREKLFYPVIDSRLSSGEVPDE